jgi:hypothetical protein
MKLAWTCITVCGLAAIIAGGCDSKSEDHGDGAGGDAGAKPAAVTAAALPADLFVDAPPADAKAVTDVKASAKAGDHVVVRGRVGGSRQPFVDGRAVFTIVDASLPTCADHPNDGCKTPWDYCCEPKDKLFANSATIQVRGADGKPLAVDLGRIGRIKAMDRIVVAGVVREKSDAGVLVVEAEAIGVEKS